ncbi:22180_t:CDS:2, partial [Gigaspora margarita]
YLKALLKEKPDWYLYELQSQMELWLGCSICLSTIWRAIHTLGYTCKQEGSMNTQDYKSFIENVLVILDNASIHRGTHLHNLCQEKGVKLEFLPPYSPEWAESIEDPLDVLDLTCITISANLAHACFQH